MSHFVVEVFSRNLEDVEKLLAPFNENLSVEQDDDGDWFNPNAKWDYWSEGGRWKNYALTRKDGKNVTHEKVRNCLFERNTDIYNHSLRYWDVVVNGAPLDEDEDPNDFHTLYNTKYYIDNFGTRERYAEEQAMGDYVPWAFVTADGDWYEKGQMLWWALSKADANSRTKFIEEFHKYLGRAYDEDLYVTLVDCHI